MNNHQETAITSSHQNNNNSHHYYQKEDPNSPTKSLLSHLLELFGNRALGLPSFCTTNQQQKNNDNEEANQIKIIPNRFNTFAQRLNRNQLQHLISIGAVKVNNEIITDCFHQLDKKDLLLLNDDDDDEKIKIEIAQEAVLDLRNKIRIWVLNKPEGVVTTFAASDTPETVQSSSTQHGNKTLLEFLEEETDLLETVKTEMTLSTRAERRRRKKEEEGKRKVHQSFPLFPVGRLDCQSCGLLLLTNCGSLCERLLHPDFEHEKEYMVKLDRKLSDGPIPERFYQLMREGVSWKPNGDRGKTVTSKPCVVIPLSNNSIQQEDQEEQEDQHHMFRIQLKEGMNRQIRNQTEAAGKQLLRELEIKKSAKEEGYHVMFLQRIGVGPLIRFEELFVVGKEDDEEEKKNPVAVELKGELKEKFLNWTFSSEQQQHQETSSSGKRREREEEDDE